MLAISHEVQTPPTPVDWLSIPINSLFRREDHPQEILLRVCDGFLVLTHTVRGKKWPAVEHERSPYSILHHSSRTEYTKCVLLPPTTIVTFCNEGGDK